MSQDKENLVEGTEVEETTLDDIFEATFGQRVDMRQARELKRMKVRHARQDAAAKVKEIQSEANEPAVVKLNPKKKIVYKTTDHLGRELNKDGTLKVAEAKLDPVNHAELKGSHADRKDKDINNDGKFDKTDEYLHKRRKAIKKATANKPIKLTPGWGDGGKSMKSSYGKLAKEEAEQNDEISGKTLASYSDKVARYGPMKDVRTRQKHEKGVYTAYKKMKAKNVKVPARMEEAEQIDELSKKTLGKYINKAKDSVDITAWRQGYKEAGAGSPSGRLEKKLTKRHKGIETAVKKLTKEDAEQIDEISAKTIDRYREQSHRKEYPGPKGSKKYEKRARGSIMAFNKLTGRAKVPARMEEAEITEARGRPKKTGQMDYTVHPKTKEKLMHNNPTHMKRIENLYRTGALKRPKTEAGQNIVTQLRKASISMRGGATVNFTHGTAKHVSAAHAQKLLDKHAGMKPAEKEAFQKKIGYSHEEMKKHV